MLQEIKRSVDYAVVGNIVRHPYTGIISYNTIRNHAKNQIFRYKNRFGDLTKDMPGEYFVAIGKPICQSLLSRNVEMVYFELRNFPVLGEHSTRKIKLIDFLTGSVDIREGGFEEQKVISVDKLEIVREFLSP